VIALGTEEYEKKILDRVSDAIVNSIVTIIDKIRPGYKKKNKAKIDERKLMLYALNRSPAGVVGLFFVILFIFFGIFGPYLARYPYNYFPVFEDPSTYFLPPGSPGFPLGTDHYGRDLLSLLLCGARTSFVISVLVIALGVPLGIILGLVAGYYGGVVDEIIMRITDIFLSFPAMILAIALSAALPDRMTRFILAHPTAQKIFLALFALSPREVLNLGRLLSVIIAMIIVWWPGYARIVRGSTLVEKESVYVEAARALGLSPMKIMFKHILPNIIGPILVYITLDFGSVVLMEAGLSYLGLGATPPIADWGRIVYDGSQYFPERWWVVILPGLVVFLVALGWNLLGDSLRDILDPKMRRSIEFKLKKKKQEVTESA